MNHEAIERRAKLMLFCTLSCVSIGSFIHYYLNGMGVAYNDARSHLDIGRRVVEGLTPGLAQLGSVWLPLPHILMIPTIWNDWMWHSGLAGALPNMIAYVWTGIIIYLFLQRLDVPIAGRCLGTLIFASNPNILYLQSTAMTEPLLIATMTTAVYELLVWQQTKNVSNLVLAAFWVMLATLTRYDGWFLYGSMVVLILLQIAMQREGYKSMEGKLILFVSLGGIGIVLWLVYNRLIFGSALYFATGPYSAGAQQAQIAAAGELMTKHHFMLSVKYYLTACVLNNGWVASLLGGLGCVVLLAAKRVKPGMRIAALALLSPLIFNILSLYIGQSVIFIPALDHHTWFNIRYGVLLAPSLAVFVGYLVGKLPAPRPVLIGFTVIALAAVSLQFFTSPTVTLADAETGASQKNVSEVSNYLKVQASGQPGFILVSSASNDAIIFSSGLPMARFITEGNGRYWDEAIQNPDHWARWIVMRTNDNTDGLYSVLHDNPQLSEYTLVDHFPFADVYELKPQYRANLITTPIYSQ